jgi:hypothetical protein
MGKPIYLIEKPLLKEFGNGEKWTMRSSINMVVDILPKN